MTLYWWMHWFWITTLKLQVLVSLFPWSPLVHAASLPLAPTVQNGHQNGPYFNEFPKEHGVTTVPSQLSTNSEQGSHYFIKDQTTTKFDITKDLTPPQLAHEPEVFTPDHEETDFYTDHETSSEDQKEAMLDDKVEEQEKHVSNKNAAIPSLETPTSSSVGKFPFSNANGNDGNARTLPHNGPLIEGSHPKGGDSKIIWIDKLSPKVLGFHDKHTKIEHLDGKVVEDALLDEVPMSDGPYNPTGSFINSTNIRVKAVGSTSKTPEMTTDKDPQFIATSDKTEEERRDKSLDNSTTTEGTVSFVTPNMVTNNSENTNIDHATENVNGSGNNLTVNSTDSDLEDDDNSTLVTVGNTTHADKTDISSLEHQQKNKSHQENMISVVSFDHSNIEESTKVSSGIVQSVIDDSVNSRGKSLNAIAITGIVIGVVVSMVLIGAASCVVYRRRYFNNPQTLNDKCSNPDSSGYIDDSTLRENSEEMYSLDNDSFLNSLEAMTIQNYWTDNVKHTKL